MLSYIIIYIYSNEIPNMDPEMVIWTSPKSRSALASTILCKASGDVHFRRSAGSFRRRKAPGRQLSSDSKAYGTSEAQMFVG